MAATVVQSKAAAVNTGDASVDIAFDSAPASGNHVLLAVGSDDYKTAEATDNGTAMTLSSECAQETFMGCYLWWRQSAGGNAFQYNIGSAATSCWILLEIDGLEASPYDVSEGQFSQASPESYTTPSMTPTAGERYMLALMGFTRSGAFTAPPNGMGTWLNSFTEITEICTVLGSGTRDQIGIASRSVTADGTTAYSSGATSDGVGGATSRVGIIIAFKVASGAISEDLNQVTTTDIAQPIGRSKARTLGSVVIDTSTAQAILRRKSRTLGIVTETSIASQPSFMKGLNRVTETQLGRSVTTVKTRAIGLTTSTDVARAIARFKSRVLGQVSETTTSRAVGKAKVKAIGRVTDTDLAMGITSSGSEPPVGLVVQTNTAQAIGRAKARAVGLVSDTSVSRSITRLKSRTIGLVTETDAARAVTGTKVKTIGRSTETGVALGLGRSKLRSIGFAAATDVARSITRLGIVGRVTETNIASSMLPSGGVPKVPDVRVWTRTEAIIVQGSTPLIVVRAADITVEVP